MSILKILCAWSTLNGIVLGSYLMFSSRTRENESNKILGVFFFLLSFKVTYPLFKDFAVMGAGFYSVYFNSIVFCYILSAPLLYIYIHSVLKGFQFKRQYILYSLVSAVIIFIPTYYNGLKPRLICFQGWIFMFLILALYQLIKSKMNIRKKLTEFFWLFGLWSGVLVVWLTVMFSFEIEMLVLFSILIVSSFFILFEKRNIIIGPESEKVNLKLACNEDESNTIAKKLELLMLDEKPYLNPKLTLPDLSKSADVPLHTLSKVLNETVGKSFPEYINTYRIQVAKEKLISNDNTNLSIAGIAYDCGFNSISAFNTFFKKSTGTTPSEFRKMVV